MTIFRSSVTLVALFLVATPAWAEGEDPNDAVEQVDGPKPKIISSGQDAGGTHAFLAVTPKGPIVFMGPTDDLAELDVLSMQRTKGGFLIDTLEEGELLFETGRTQRVIKRGVPGFNSPQPTIVMSAAVDPGLLDQVRRKLGGTEPKNIVSVDTPDMATVRFPAAQHQVAPGHGKGPTAMHATARRARLRARSTSRGRARRPAR